MSHNLKNRSFLEEEDFEPAELRRDTRAVCPYACPLGMTTLIGSSADGDSRQAVAEEFGHVHNSRAP